MLLNALEQKPTITAGSVPPSIPARIVPMESMKTGIPSAIAILEGIMLTRNAMAISATA